MPHRALGMVRLYPCPAHERSSGRAQIVQLPLRYFLAAGRFPDFCYLGVKKLLGFGEAAKRLGAARGGENEPRVAIYTGWLCLNQRTRCVRERDDVIQLILVPLAGN